MLALFDFLNMLKHESVLCLSGKEEKNLDDLKTKQKKVGQ